MYSIGPSVKIIEGAAQADTSMGGAHVPVQ